ncbi:hypothetical protein GCM10007933_02280 [Zoogloea oryzae]|uniref:DUF1515 domain-containing protein n=1 Tax=Zoogloea oryzae TaxID=310767 RepID=A0ABQ6F7J8_9RHOO|nr:hypothetical protein [Zoogloea oryzae]GLT20776.1 hypothetical protein GCM10007933_02280 [Zoogloea oryzae]
MSGKDDPGVGLGVVQEALDGVREDVREIRAAMSKMADAVVRLAVLEERHAVVSSAQDRAFGAISKLSDRVRDLEQAIPEKLEARIRDLEQAQPVQRLTSGWIVAACGFCGGLFVMVVLKKIGVM